MAKHAQDPSFMRLLARFVQTMRDPEELKVCDMFHPFSDLFQISNLYDPEIRGRHVAFRRLSPIYA